MNANKALWEKGDFTRIAAFMRDSGEAVVDSLGVAPHMQALDVGCGDGTTAVPLARKAATVLGIDISGPLVAAGRKRAQLGKIENLTFREGDASDLQGVAADTFDLTLSMFGAMFAPRPFDVAGELVRVTRPGGRIVMGNWIPNDPSSFVSQLLKISSAFSPPPPEGFVSPMTWGVEGHIAERFGKAGIPRDRISLERDTYYFRSDEFGPDIFVDLLMTFYGPTMNAVDAARASGREAELRDQLLDMAAGQNVGGANRTEIPATFLRVTVAA